MSHIHRRPRSGLVRLPGGAWRRAPTAGRAHARTAARSRCRFRARACRTRGFEISQGRLGLVPRASVPPPNPQSPFDGLRAGFVNASSGNLTFRRRDIVAQGPVAFARVHDSRIAANADFGPGWRLSLAEELLADGDAVTHVDGSGARQGFAWGAAGHAASPPTPRREGTRLTFEDVGGARVATLVDGEATRTFERAGGTGTRWAVRTVATRARTLEFGHEGGRLASVSRDGATLFEIDRDADGRIAPVRDGHGRSVSYAYDADGRLETVRDLAGSDWNHRCRDDGLLVAAVDPEGRTCLAVEHDDAGRVARASADGRVHACACGPDATAVTEGTGERHTLLRGASGVTVGVSSTTGASWTATLDASNRVSTLALPGRAVAYAYDAEGRVETVAETTPDGTTTTRSFEHDGRGRLASATGGPDPVTVTYAGNGVHVLAGSEAFEHETDDRGRVVSVRRGGEPEIRVGRDRAGNVVEISQGHRNARFGRDELGRIADAAFADGSSVRYSHDELGNRVLAEHSDGSSVAYGYDRAGRTTGVRETRRDGGVRLWTAPVDGIAGQASHDGPVELESASVAALHLGGDPRGAIGEPAATAGAGGDGVVRVPADGVGVLMGDHRNGSQPVHGEAASAGSAPGAEWRHPAAAVPHLRLQPDYGSVALGEDLEVAQTKPLEARVPGLRFAKALAGASMPPIRGTEELTGPALPAAEYRAVGKRATKASTSPSTGGKGAQSRGVACAMPVCKPVLGFGGFDRCTKGMSQALDPTRDTNGCSAPVPTLFQDTFTPSCDVHDVCYNRCGSGQDSCDGEFAGNLQRACGTVPATAQLLCRSEAVAYAAAVALAGEPHYEDAQVRHCHCCN